MPKKSAGILVYRLSNGFVEVFLGHPGGPFYVKKDLGVWSIPKGEFTLEDPLAAAQREFKEETGFTVSGDFRELRPVRQKSGKTVYAWATAADLDATMITSNTFQIEFPPRSGRLQEFPEIDRAGWFSLKDARQKILSYQLPLLDELETLLTSQPPTI